MVGHLHEDPGPVDGIQTHQTVFLDKGHVGKHGLDGLVQLIAVPLHCQRREERELS